MSIASDLFRTVTVKIHDISQQLPYIVVNQADEWPEWVRPTSKDTQYWKGNQVTFTGRHYTCVKNNVSSSPDEDKKSWRLV